MVRGAPIATGAEGLALPRKEDGSLVRPFQYLDEVEKDAAFFSVRGTPVVQISHPLLRRRRGVDMESQG